MISLTSLTIIADEALHTNEVRVHPDLVEAIRQAFVEGNLSEVCIQITSGNSRIRLLRLGPADVMEIWKILGGDDMS